MNDPKTSETETDAVAAVGVQRLVRLIDVERVTVIREIIPVKARAPKEAFDKARSTGKVLHESKTVEYIIKEYPEDH